MKHSESATNKIRQKVEKMGVFFEKSGYSPMPGRVFAYLLLSEPPHKTFYQIQDFLKASKSAISNALKFLMNQGLVDYITFSGDRKRYFKVSVKGWIDQYKERFRDVAILRDLAQDVLLERSNSKYADFNEEIQQMINFQTHIAEGLVALTKSWEEKNK